MKLITGNSNPPLARAISAYLEIPLTKLDAKRFADDEIFVEIKENVRGEDIFLIQSTGYPANDNLMEMLVLIDALKRASAARITAVLPYYGYARQDRKPGPRTPISAKLVANLLTGAGADRALCVDLHAGQIQGFFDIPMDNLFAAPVIAADIHQRYGDKDIMVVSPDVGGVVRARALAKRLDDAPLAIVDKRRERAGVSEVMNIIGDVKGKCCIMIDDIIDSGGTLVNAAKALLDQGAEGVVAYITHGVLSGKAVERVEQSSLTELVITDSLLLPGPHYGDFERSLREIANAVNVSGDDLRAMAEKTLTKRESSKIRQLTIAPLIGEAIRRIADNSSVSSLYD